MKKFLLGATALIAMFAGSAMAADMPVKAPVMKAPPPAPVAVYSWTGCYIGINGGGIRNDTRYTLRPTGDFLTGGFVATNPLRTDSATIDGTAGTVGGTVGCNWQSGAWVWGVEGDANWAGVNDRDTVSRALAAPLGGNFVHTVTDKVEWFSTIRGRLGWAGDRWLVYGTGGVAFGNVKSASNVLFTSAGDTYIGASSQSKAGWTAGGGLEFAVTNNWSLKGEYLYVDLGKRGYLDPNVAPPAFPTFSYTTDLNTRFHVVRAGLNYKF